MRGRPPRSQASPRSLPPEGAQSVPWGGPAGLTFLITLFAFAVSAFAQPNAALDTRLKKLEEVLRCLVCQNQSLADSSAPLAEDLRREVRGLAVAGKSDDEIKQFLVARYGDFVLYDPPVKRITWFLWFGPFVLLAIGAGIWWAVTRRRRKGSDVDGDPPPPSGVDKARELLDSPLE